MKPTVENELIDYAKAIQTYCKETECNECVFHTSVNCRFVSSDTPYGWDFDDKEDKRD